MPVAASSRLTRPPGGSVALPPAAGPWRKAGADQVPAGRQHRLVHEPLRLGRPLVAGGVGPRGGAHVELQPPLPVAAQLPRTTSPACRSPSASRAVARGTVSAAVFRPDCSTVRIGGSGVSCSGSTASRSPGRSVVRVAETYSGNSAGWRISSSNVRPDRSTSCPSSTPAGSRQTADCDGGHRRCHGFDAEVIGVGQAAGDAHAVAPADHAVVGRPARHGQVQPIVAQHFRPPGLVARGREPGERTSIRRSRSTGDSNRPPLNRTRSGRAGSDQPDESLAAVLAGAPSGSR